MFTLIKNRKCVGVTVIKTHFTISIPFISRINTYGFTNNIENTVFANYIKLENTKIKLVSI